MTRTGILAAVIGGTMIIATVQSRADPLKTMDDVGAALLECWSPPSGTDGAFVTLSFSFKRDGSLIGTPRPTAINVEGDQKAREAFVAAAIAAMDKCLPLEFAPSLAAGIAGRVYTLEFKSPEN